MKSDDLQGEDFSLNSLTLRFFPFFFLFDRLLNHRQASFLAAANGGFHVDQLEVQRFVQSETRLNVLNGDKGKRHSEFVRPTHSRLDQRFRAGQTFFAAERL